MRIKHILPIVFTFICSYTCYSQQSAPMLLGEITKYDFLKEPYKSWFETNYNEYKIDFSDFKSLKKGLKKTEIIVFLGTWCGDTRREVPRFIKILDESKFDKKKVKYIGLDRLKSAPGYDDYDIEFVPTFIFFKKGHEYGRIIESPIETLERDMINILSKNRKNQ